MERQHATYSCSLRLFMAQRIGPVARSSDVQAMALSDVKNWPAYLLILQKKFDSDTANQELNRVSCYKHLSDGERQRVTYSERIGHALLPLHKLASGLVVRAPEDPPVRVSCLGSHHCHSPTKQVSAAY
eukprot:Skav206022  [mRNA]  locus=scaffold2270:24874:28823:- [translate_table: standard]